ncbi:MAG: hypothetical protein P8M79_11345, partial [Alphaproteobacteria bacterium]|nr:hypothetical protein [Alphaproteobacteria bacterium]
MKYYCEIILQKLGFCDTGNDLSKTRKRRLRGGMWLPMLAIRLIPWAMMSRHFLGGLALIKGNIST